MESKRLHTSSQQYTALKRSSTVCLMYLFFDEGHLHPTGMSSKSPGMSLQAGFYAAPDLMLCIHVPTSKRHRQKALRAS